MTTLGLEEIASLIEDSPLKKALWQQLYEITVGHKDIFSAQSIEIIVRGLGQIEEFQDNATCQLALVLRRLAGSFNNPRLFKEAGRAYFQDFHLPKIAREHLERAASLGCSDPDLPIILDAIANIEGQMAGCPRGDFGVKRSRLTSSITSDVIRRSGKLGLERPKLSSASLNLIPFPRFSFTEEETQSTAPAENLERAWNAIAVADWPAAQNLLGTLTPEAVGTDPLWEAWTQLGESAFRAGQAEPTEYAFREAAHLLPELLISQFNLGVGLQMTQKYPEALEAYERADSISPDHPKVWCNIGNIYFSMDDLALAENALLRAVSFRPNYARAWDNLGAALGAQGKFAPAINACRKALSLQPIFPEASFKLGILYFNQKSYGEALPQLAAASSLPNLSAFTNAYLSMSLAGLGKIAGAERALNMAAKSPGSQPALIAMAWHAIGRACLESLQYEKAREALENACRLNPNESQFWLDLGLSFQFANEAAQAIECFKRAIELDELAA